MQQDMCTTLLYKEIISDATYNKMRMLEQLPSHQISGCDVSKFLQLHRVHCCYLKKGHIPQCPTSPSLSHDLPLTIFVYSKDRDSS